MKGRETIMIIVCIATYYSTLSKLADEDDDDDDVVMLFQGRPDHISGGESCCET